MSQSFEGVPETTPVINKYQIFAGKIMEVADKLQNGSDSVRKIIAWGDDFPDMKRNVAIEMRHPEVVTCAGASALKNLIATNDNLHGHSQF